MQAAAQTRGVPLALVEATAYVNTRWEWVASPSVAGGIGPMDVRASQMPLASSLTGHTEAEIRGDLAANLDAGAALMAHYHSTGTDLASWRPAVASTQGPRVADEIFGVLQAGASRTTSTGETITLAPQAVVTGSGGASSADGAAATTAPAGSVVAAAAANPDYPAASWVPADPSNYSVSNRTHNYPIDMIVVHDIEGSASSAIQMFQSPGFAASAHYVVDYNGAITQMVLEKDIAWHAGNWDYNTRAIGIEHAGFAAYSLYTTAEYNASAALAASICSRYGVPLDRTHVIGHSEVPDPNNPGLYGGSDHHWDPGPYWNWSYYMATAQTVAATLPSPPHLMPDPVAGNTATGVTVTWAPARTCRTPVAGYTVTGQPGNLSQTLPATATSATFDNLQPGTRYTFTVTAKNADGQDSRTTNSAIPGACTNARLTANPAGTQVAGNTVAFSAGSSTCANPRYEFWMLPPGGVWTDVQPYSSRSTFAWSTAGRATGTYSFAVWAQDATSPGVSGNSAGRFDTRFGLDYRLTGPPCTATNVSVSPAGATMTGTTVTLTASATGCSTPIYEFWLQNPSGAWSLARPYSTNATYSWSTAGWAPGSYRFSVWSRDQGSDGVAGTAPNTYDSFSAFPYTVTAGCPTMTASASPASSAAAGATVTVTAAASGCPNPRYQFWLLPPSGVWQVVQPYSTSSSFTWRTAGWSAGTYRFSVWVRDASRSSSYDTFSAFDYGLATTPCSSTTTAASPASSADIGTNVTVSTSSSGCPNPLYQFWLFSPGGAWQVVQPYSATTSFAWSTAGRAPGVYRFSIWSRDARSSAAYDSFQAFDYALVVTPCTAMTATATPATSAPRGTTVTIFAAASGCPNPTYQFYVLPPGGTWMLVQPWSASATLTWTTTNKAAGTYRFSVWARDASSSASYDAFQAFDYGLT